MYVGFISKRDGSALDFKGVETLLPSPISQYENNVHVFRWYWRLINYKDQTTRLVSIDEYKLAFVSEE